MSGAAGGTFGAKSSFGAFAQMNQPNAFAQAAGLGGGQSAFMQSGGGQGFTQQSAGAFGDSGNRFQVLSEVAADASTDGDKDDDMTDEPSPLVEKTPTFGNRQTSADAPTAQPVPPPEPASTAPAPPFQPTLAAQSSVTVGLATAPTEPPKPAPPVQQPPRPTQLAQPTSTQTAQPTPTRPVASEKKSVIDEMTAWMADRFTIGQIPETEPPLEVR